MSTNMVRNNPPIMAALEKNILEHISLMAQEQIELEFAETIQQLPMMQQMAQQNPQVHNSYKRYLWTWKLEKLC